MRANDFERRLSRIEAASGVFGGGGGDGLSPARKAEIDRRLAALTPNEAAEFLRILDRRKLGKLLDDDQARLLTLWTKADRQQA